MLPDDTRSDADSFRVLATAYACEPGRGSEPGIGWHWAREIARRHELTLVTRRNNVEAIREAADRENLAFEVVGHDLADPLVALKRGPRGAMPYYYAWQRSLARVCTDLARTRTFDVTHHLTFASGWVPSGLAKLDLPFVFGPVGEHPAIPGPFLRHATARERIADRLRFATKRSMPVVDPQVARTWAAADVILSLGRTFEARLPAHEHHKLAPMLACGVEASALAAPAPRVSGSPMRVLFAGRLVELKGVRLAMHAVSLLPSDVDVTFDLVGDGPLRDALERRANGIDVPVHFHGQLDHDATLAAMRESDVLLFPSFEGAGMVVPEAMASGCAVVALACGGPGEMTSEGRGIAVPLEATFEATASELAKALEHLARHDSLRLGFAERGHAWARRESTWDAKGKALAAIYHRAVERRANPMRSAA